MIERILLRLWHDDCGAVVSTEYVMVSGLVVGGVGSGMVAVRNAGVRQANALAETMADTSTIPTPAEVRAMTAMPTYAATQPAPVQSASVVVNNTIILPPSP